MAKEFLTAITSLFMKIGTITKYFCTKFFTLSNKKMKHLLTLFLCCIVISCKKETSQLSFLEVVDSLQNTAHCYNVLAYDLEYDPKTKTYTTSSYACGISRRDICDSSSIHFLKRLPATEFDKSLPYVLSGLDSLTWLDIEYIDISDTLSFRQKSFKGFGIKKCTVREPILLINSDSTAIDFGRVNFKNNSLEKILNYEIHKKSLYTLNIAYCTMKNDTIEIKDMSQLKYLQLYSNQKKYLKIENCPHLEYISVDHHGSINIISELSKSVKVY
jgi:hypothetical protein